MREYQKQLSGLVLAATLATPAHAYEFVDLVDFEGSGVGYDESYLQIKDQHQYRHRVRFEPPAGTIKWAALTLRHRNNKGNKSERWFVEVATPGGPVLLGELRASQTEWAEQSFRLPAELSQQFAGKEWEIAIRSYDTTSGVDELRLSWSRIEGFYVPEVEESTAAAPPD